ncbi:hypothetical protein [Synechocystis sp. PCC 7509]|uniref:hypothetical protein n=1 Tax=Synechocystis sp. PCC 7509 TaxID=927677 RepID=UPI0002ACF453|nr:hypothetical protein [Synechocystis sp. PCC 7509]
MAQAVGVVDMNIGSGRTIHVVVPQKIITYFGIAVSATPIEGYLRKRKAYTRKVRESGALNDRVVRVAAVEGAEWYDSRGANSGGIIGKLIKIPTQLRADPAVATSPIRLVSLRVPAAASNYAIAQWIKGKFVSKPPGYYITNSGVLYPTNVPVQADPNPGNTVPPVTP